MAPTLLSSTAIDLMKIKASSWEMMMRVRVKRNKNKRWPKVILTYRKTYDDPPFNWQHFTTTTDLLDTIVYTKITSKSWARWYFSHANVNVSQFEFYHRNGVMTQCIQQYTSSLSHWSQLLNLQHRLNLVCLQFLRKYLCFTIWMYTVRGYYHDYCSLVIQDNIITLNRKKYK